MMLLKITWQYIVEKIGLGWNPLDFLATLVFFCKEKSPLSFKI